MLSILRFIIALIAAVYVPVSEWLETVSLNQKRLKGTRRCETCGLSHGYAWEYGKYSGNGKAWSLHFCGCGKGEW